MHHGLTATAFVHANMYMYTRHTHMRTHAYAYDGQSRGSEHAKKLTGSVAVYIILAITMLP